MNNLAIYGAGGFGRETALMIEQINAVQKIWNLVGFFDDGLTAGEKVNGREVLGDIDTVNQVKEPLALAVAIAAPFIRRNVVEAIKNPLINYPVLKHPAAMIGDETNFFGRGTIITAGCILTTSIVLGEFVIINLASTVGHDVSLGSFCTVMPGCSISGNVSLVEGTLVGTGARILQNLSVAKDSQIGAGAVVTKSFEEPGVVLTGVPAKIKGEI